MNEEKNNITGEIKMYNSSDEDTTDYGEAVRAKKTVGTLTYISTEKHGIGDWIWVEQKGGKRRRSFKKSKKGGNKQTMTMGGRKSKKSKKGGKKSKKSRKH